MKYCPYLLNWVLSNFKYPAAFIYTEIFFLVERIGHTLERVFQSKAVPVIFTFYFYL